MPVLPPPLVGVDDKPFRVLLTGFGPFSRYAENPSWLAVKPLHNVVLDVDPPPVPVSHHDQSVMAVNEPGRRQIHITTLMVPVTYEAVLSLVPGFHTRPPTLPEPHDPAFPIPAPPEGGYDFILHVGVAGRGPLRMEKLGHKLGYGMKDAQGKLAPIVELTASGGTAEITEAERIERERLPVASVDVSGDGGDQPVRGFGKGYEIFDEEIYTDIDVERLVAVMKESGYQIYTSMDAGHYLCDFIYYCSLAESRRTSCRQDKHEKGRGSQVLFLHCPPVHQPLSTQEVTEALKSIIVWVARGA